MKPYIHAAASILFLLPLLLSAQPKPSVTTMDQDGAPSLQTAPSLGPSPNADTRQVPACREISCRGGRIRNDIGTLQFCVPRGLAVRRAVGEHGDVHYRIAVRRHGGAFELLIVTGPYFPGTLPEWTNGCAGRHWYSPESKGDDCRTAIGSAVSRYVTLNAPTGFGVYRDVPADVAASLDRVLDSLCWSDLAGAPIR
jgi:hypothetical protein